MYKYIIEQWDTKEEKWFPVGETNSRYSAICSVRNSKKDNRNIFYRIVMVINIC